MINFRFHLISLVAVFLALGVGVALGASFVDRATVETLQGRVDDLDAGFRDRGAQIEELEGALATADAQAAALAGPDSAALAGRLSGQPVVLVLPDGVPAPAVDGVRAALRSAGATDSGTLRLLPGLALSDDAGLEAAAERLGLEGFAPGELRERVLEDLGAALALLGGGAGGSAATTTTTTTTTAPAGQGAPGAAPAPAVPAPLVRPTDAAGAREYLDTLVELGLVAVDATGATPGGEFPAVTGVQYVVVVGAETTPDSAAVVVPLASATGRAAPAVVTVGEAAPVRPAGTPPTTATGAPPPVPLLAPLRDGPAAARVSTVDDLNEAFGWLATAFAVAAHRTGSVGAYGTGPDATAPFPTVPTP